MENRIYKKDDGTLVITGDHIVTDNIKLAKYHKKNGDEVFEWGGGWIITVDKTP